jgi:quinol monooxygenase YgiN
MKSRIQQDFDHRSKKPNNSAFGPQSNYVCEGRPSASESYLGPPSLSAVRNSFSTGEPLNGDNRILSDAGSARRQGSGSRGISEVSRATRAEEKGTLKWYAFKIGPGKFGIFDTFADEAGRNAHIGGDIAKALGARAADLFSVPPQIDKVELLVSTPLKG